MLGQNVWFDAGWKEMVLCYVKGYGSMLDRRGWFNARFKNWFFCGVSNRQVIGCQQLIWWERKNTNLAGAK